MPAPETTADFVALIRKSRLISEEELQTFSAVTPAELSEQLQNAGLLTRFQADQLLRGRHKGFVLGKYRLLDRIGMGGMGQVYSAEHMSMRRRVAIKVLPPDRSGNQFARERFIREARAAAAVEHPNLIRVFDIENEGEVFFLVMEYIDGVSLHDLVVRRGPLDPNRAAHYIAQSAAGLSALHERCLVHRDVKPANLLLARDGTVKVLDLGLVRSELDDDELTRQEGAKLVGTADYLAPEQALNCSKVDSRADLYGLGATAYYLLTGSPPFTAEKLSQKLIAHQVQVAKPVHQVRPEIPVELSAVVQQMLAKLPDERLQSAADVVASLQPWIQVFPPLPSPEDFPEDATVGAPVSAALSFANRLVGSSLAAASMKATSSRPSAVATTTPAPLSGGSAIRFGIDHSSSHGSGSEKTTSMGSDDTATRHPVPGTPLPMQVTLDDISGATPIPFEVIPLQHAAIHGRAPHAPSPKHASSTSMKIDSLFRTPMECADQDQRGSNWLNRLWSRLFG